MRNELNHPVGSFGTSVESKCVKCTSLFMRAARFSEDYLAILVDCARSAFDREQVLAVVPINCLVFTPNFAINFRGANSVDFPITPPSCVCWRLQESERHTLGVDFRNCGPGTNKENSYRLGL